MLLTHKNSILLIIDVQTALFPVIKGRELCLRNIGTLLAVREKLNIPVLVTKQYPQGLGRTIYSILNTVRPIEVLSKTHFSCAREPTILAALQSTGRRQIVISGMEAHVCVLQSALELMAHGFKVYVVEDAVSSRKNSDYKAALARLSRNNIEVVTTEMVIFEWLEKACTEEFRNILPLIKNQ